MKGSISGRWGEFSTNLREIHFFFFMLVILPLFFHFFFFTSLSAFPARHNEGFFPICNKEWPLFSSFNCLQYKQHISVSRHLILGPILPLYSFPLVMISKKWHDLKKKREEEKRGKIVPHLVVFLKRIRFFPFLILLHAEHIYECPLESHSLCFPE